MYNSGIPMLAIVTGLGMLFFGAMAIVVAFAHPIVGTLLLIPTDVFGVASWFSVTFPRIRY